MKADTRFSKSWVRALYSKSMSDPLCEFPAELGHRPRLLACLHRVQARGRPLVHALHDSLRDAGSPEEVVGEIEVPVPRIDRPPAHARAIHRDVFGLRRDAEGRVVDAAQPA